MTAIHTFDRWQRRLWYLVQIHKNVCKEEGVKTVAEVDSWKLRSEMHVTIKQVSLLRATGTRLGFIQDVVKWDIYPTMLKGHPTLN